MLQFRRLPSHGGGLAPYPESPARQVYSGVATTRALPKADMRCRSGRAARPRCCSLRQPQKTCQRVRIHCDLRQHPNLQLDLDCSENAEMSELRRCILMRRAACSLVIHAMSPCSCTGSPRCNAASLALRTGRRGWELVWVADLGEFAADAMTWRRMPGRGVRRQRHGLPGGAAIGDCPGPAGTGGGARSLSWSGASCVVSCPGWSAADASVAVGCLGGWYWLGPGPGSVRYAVRCWRACRCRLCGFPGQTGAWPPCAGGGAAN
jgi:hypothetical protein